MIPWIRACRKSLYAILHLALHPGARQVLLTTTSQFFSGSVLSSFETTGVNSHMYGRASSPLREP
eukprot:3496866-Amphidinium_carterae.2